MAHLREKVQQALNELLPAMVADGGGAELIEVKEGIAIIRLTGSCSFCPSRKLSAESLKGGLLQRVSELREVVVVYPSFTSLAVPLQEK